MVLILGRLWTQRKWCCHYKMKPKKFPISGSVLCVSEHWESTGWSFVFDPRHYEHDGDDDNISGDLVLIFWVECSLKRPSLRPEQTVSTKAACWRYGSFMYCKRIIKMQITTPAKPILLPNDNSLNPRCLALSRQRSPNPCSLPIWNNSHSCTKKKLDCRWRFKPMEQQVHINTD